MPFDNKEFEPNIYVRLLRRARNVLVTHGWLQGRWGDSVNGFCAHGALRKVIMDMRPTLSDDEISDGFYRCASVLAKELPQAWEADTPAWNDAKDRTKDEVLALFDRAIDRAMDMPAEAVTVKVA